MPLMKKSPALDSQWLVFSSKVKMFLSTKYSPNVCDIDVEVLACVQMDFQGLSMILLPVYLR